MRGAPRILEEQAEGAFPSPRHFPHPQPLAPNLPSLPTRIIQVSRPWHKVGPGPGARRVSPLLDLGLREGRVAESGPGPGPRATLAGGGAGGACRRRQSGDGSGGLGSGGGSPRPEKQGQRLGTDEGRPGASAERGPRAQGAVASLALPLRRPRSNKALGRVG